jgi:K+-sensing histidine kinase KdpD
MRDDLQTLTLQAAGVLGSILLGIALIPLREATYSGNFIFLFVILIIVVSEFAGRWAAIATAACSALSLNFFLTRPYLSLRIEGTHDIIAFAGLTVCGLVAATLGSRRSETAASLRDAEAHLALLHSVAKLAQEAEPIPARLEETLRASRDALPLSGLVVLNTRGEAIAASGRAPDPRPVPALVLHPDTLLLGR